MPKKYFSIQNKASDSSSVDILIYGVIGDSWFEESITARQFVADLKALEKDYQRINVRINSPGGSVWDGIPIFNAIKNSTADIHTYNDGLCASMAAIILLSGKTVHSADNALLMLHSPISGVYGNAGDFEQVLEMLNKVQDSLISCITSRNTGKTADEIKAAYFDHKDHFLNADEALAENFIDEIVKGNNKVSDKIKDLNHDQVIDQFNKLVKSRTIFDKWFSSASDIFLPNSEIDMNIKTLAKACGLPETATEQEVLDWIEEHKAHTADDSADDDADASDDDADDQDDSADDADDTSDDDASDDSAPDAKDQEIARLKAENQALKKAPGAKNKKVVKTTDSKTTKANDFDTYKEAKSTWDTVDNLFK